MAKDGRALREEAATAVAAGKHKRALAAYLELERLEPGDAQWAKRAGETYRRLGNNANAIAAFERSAGRYAQNGFLVQAIAVCKLILQIDPKHADTFRRLAEMNEQIGASQTRVASMAENNPALHENPSVAALRQGQLGQAGQKNRAAAAGSPRNLDDGLSRPRKDAQGHRSSKESTPPVVSPGRTRSRPIALPLGAALDRVDLKSEVPDSHPREGIERGIHVIPIDDDDLETTITRNVDHNGESSGIWILESQVPDDDLSSEFAESTEIVLSEFEEIPLPQPRVIGAAAARALAATPLFAGMPSDALQELVANLQLVLLERGEQLFREGDPGDALYVIVEGEVSVQGDGSPPVEVSRLGPGTFLGEVALMTDQPRSATVVCVQAAELLRIDRHTLSRVLANHGDVLRAVLRFVRDRLVDRWMRTSPLFHPFNDAQRAELAAKFEFLEIDDGTVLLGAGDHPNGLYIVLAGQFLVLRNRSTMAQLGPGDLIGETALLSGEAFKSDVVARGKCLALCLPAAAFREVIMTHPHVLAYIGEQAELSRRLQVL
ncbi:MAG TPA: cyclic nucleotide-binding domain-containing protein [Kofleriaceae bacterium]|jgi:CRP-like cAMP-binding protein|nr:cyclic nucleotide-binding domain-containing protein [Kofleriaceae bacterium]